MSKSQRKTPTQRAQTPGPVQILVNDRGVMFRGPGPGMRVESLAADSLAAGVREFVATIGSVLTSAKHVGDFELEEVLIRAEISATGKLTLIGGLEGTASGAVEFKFVRPQ